MGIFDRLKFWKPLTPISEAGQVRLNPYQMAAISKYAQMTGMPEGVDYLPLDMFEKICEKWPDFRTLNAYSGRLDRATAAQVAAALGSLYTRATETRREMVAEVDAIRNFYLVDVIVSQIVEDSLSPDVTTDQIFRLQSSKPDIQSELETIEADFNLDKVVREIMPEVIRYGEYTLSTVVKTDDAGRNEAVISNLSEAEDKTEFDDAQSGLVQLNDNVDQTEVVAICKNTEVSFYLQVTERSGRIGLERRHKSAFVQFRLDSERVRIDLQKEFNGLSPEMKEKIAELPRFVRVGKSFIQSMIPKIKELELLEKLAPATRLSELAAGTLIGVQVPAGYDLEQGKAAAQALENIINRRLAVEDSRGRISVESILTSTGRTKVIPLFGDKGQTNVMQTRSQAPNDLSADINTLRKVILDGIGIPFELIFSSDGASKTDILKRYSRYLRKLKAVQKCVKDGLVQIASIHLAAKGIEFEPEDITVNFHNKLIELDNLDKLEFIDGSISLLSNTKQFVEEMLGSVDFGPHMDKIAFIEWLKDQVRLVGLEDLIVLNPKLPEEDPAVDPGADPSADPEADLDPNANPEAGGDPSQPDNLQHSSLNGQQVKSLLDVVSQVAQGQIPRDTGVRILMSAFSLPPDEAETLMGSVGRDFVPIQQQAQGQEPPAADKQGEDDDSED